MYRNYLGNSHSKFSRTITYGKINQEINIKRENVIKRMLLFCIISYVVIPFSIDAMPQRLLIDYDYPQQIARYVGKENNRPICITLQDLSCTHDPKIPLWEIIIKSDIDVSGLGNWITKYSMVLLQLDKSKEYLACGQDGVVYFSLVENEDTTWQKVIFGGDRVPVYASKHDAHLSLLKQLLQGMTK